MDRREKAKELVSQMTLAEKASLCSGKDNWSLKGVPRLGLTEIMMTDGPHGLRKQSVGSDSLDIFQSLPAVCFPTASALACSYDRRLIYEVGKAIAEECRQENVAVVLGPGINIKRSPLCGRNFEYYSEDPFVSGELAAAFIQGVQSQNVGASLKHFAANNQEKRRMTVDSVMDERTLREIYLAGFERAIKKAQPWTVMCSYNRIEGEHASQNKRLLTDILRGEWGFDGLVVSDWGATVDRVKGLAAGLDLEMPHFDDTHDRQIVAAVERGLLSVEVLDQAAQRVTELILRAGDRQELQYDLEAHHALARRAAAESAVLLKNEGMLPGKTTDKAAVIGAFAVQPRYQGTGSSKVVPVRLDSALEELCELGLEPEYAQGYWLDCDHDSGALVAEACRVAKDKDIVYIFAGLPDSYEAESFDRENMKLPVCHDRLIEAVSQVNERVVVILQGGAPMELPWAERVQGILLMYLGGEASGGACADVLLGRVNPSGKLAESWPFTNADSPASAFFPGYPLSVEYRENIFVGYRYYDTAKKELRYPFGFGLSYTQFEYSDLSISSSNIADTDTMTASCRVRNTGSTAGSEVVQLYLAKQGSIIIRAEQELKGFEKIYLQPGESQEVHFHLEGRDFAYYNTNNATWHVEAGAYELRIGASSRDIRLTAVIQVTSTIEAPLPDLREEAACYYDLSGGLQVSDEAFIAVLGRPLPARERQTGAAHTINSTFSDIQDKWLGRQFLKIIWKKIDKLGADNPDIKLLAEKTIMDAPLRQIATWSTGDGNGGFSTNQMEGLVDLLNGKLIKGLVKVLRKKKEIRKS